MFCFHFVQEAWRTAAHWTLNAGSHTILKLTCVTSHERTNQLTMPVRWHLEANTAVKLVTINWRYCQVEQWLWSKMTWVELRNYKKTKNKSKNHTNNKQMQITNFWKTQITNFIAFVAIVVYLRWREFSQSHPYTNKPHRYLPKAYPDSAVSCFYN